MISKVGFFFAFRRSHLIGAMTTKPTITHNVHIAIVGSNMAAINRSIIIVMMMPANAARQQSNINRIFVIILH